MNSTKLYVWLYMFNQFAMIACITICTLHFHKPGLMWWYLLPALCFSLQESSPADEQPEKEDSNNVKKY